jgi:hypothetical protein
MRADQIVVLKKNWFEEWVPKTFVEITNSYQQRLGDMTEDDTYKEGFNNLEDFKVKWVDFTGIEWSSELVVYVYELKVKEKFI